MTISGRACCARCGAWLRRTRQRGVALCDPCHRAGPDPRRELPPGFFFQDPIAAALANYDFGTVFRTVRERTGWSQQTLGNLVGLDQTRISAIERRICRLRDVGLVARVATGLWIPSILLGFSDRGTTVGQAGIDARKVVSWMDRRDFVQHVAALSVGVTGVVGLDIDRLIALLPHSEPTGTRHIGAADVETIEQATAAFVRQDFAHGSGMARDTAVAHLRASLSLLDAEVSADVRPRLHIAIARLATQAGWMSYDVKQHDAARRLWMIGLDLARAADHPLGTDQTVFLLYDMAIQAVHLQRPDEALRLVHLGHAAAAGSHAVSAATNCWLVNIQAQAHAALGDSMGCDRALGQGIEQFGAIDSATRPPWGIHLGEPHLASFQGATHYALALSGHDLRAASRAVPLLRQAVDNFGCGYARSKALYLPDLAGAHALAGDADTAVSVGHQAVDAVTALSSPRTYDRLRVLNTALEPLHNSTGVAELRNRLTTTTAA
ncbi:MAG: helix-turn-helix domain-containing protein [Pseudonocardiaceae bacterium]